MNNSDTPLLKISKVSKRFGETIAVKELSYEIFPRDFVETRQLVNEVF